MGRRSLKKVDQQLDLSQHLHSWETLPRPLVLQSLIKTPGPLEIEVGCGKGLFLLKASDEFPSHRFLGIELSRKYARFSAFQLAKRGQPNAAVIQGDAIAVLSEGVLSSSATALHLYFPDPWWKTRHRKRRMMNESFMEQVVRVVEPGGRFVFWTDVKAYFEMGQKVIAKCQELSASGKTSDSKSEQDPDYQTNFERRMRLAGKPVYRSEFLRR